MSSWCFLSLQLFLPSPPAAIPQGLWGAEGVSSSWASQPFFHLFPRIGETYFYLKGWPLASCMNTGNKLLPLPQQYQLRLWIITWLSKECCWLVAEMSVLCALCLLFCFNAWWSLFPILPFSLHSLLCPLSLKMTLILCPSNLFSAVSGAGCHSFPNLLWQA